MHELGIASGILNSAIDAAEGANAVRINAVDVSIGAFTEVMEDALQFAWESLRTGTMAETARLNVTVLEGCSRCADCGHEFAHGRFDGARCPACDSYLIQLVRGRELKIDSIDID